MDGLELGSTDKNASAWLWSMLEQSLFFALFTGLYNRLPKTALHGPTAPILHAFLGNSTNQQPSKGNELTANLIKYVTMDLADWMFD